jgi:hypothetical protein
MHEVGHNVDQAFGATRLSSGRAWDLAAQNSRARLNAIDLHLHPPASGAFALTTQDNPNAVVPHGVTSYGRNSRVEDFAESFAFHQHGKSLASARLPHRPTVYQDLSFADLHPSRAAYLDRVVANLAVRAKVGRLTQ